MLTTYYKLSYIIYPHTPKNTHTTNHTQTRQTEEGTQETLLQGKLNETLIQCQVIRESNSQVNCKNIILKKNPFGTVMSYSFTTQTTRRNGKKKKISLKSTLFL